jgi:hypothetical protein
MRVMWGPAMLNQGGRIAVNIAKLPDLLRKE